MKASIYETITAQIVAAIEEGAGLYRMPWHRARSDVTNPVNVVSGRSYRGPNIISLWMTGEARGYQSGTWATYRQWQEKGAQVRKGEKCAPVFFWKNLDSDGEADAGTLSGIIKKLDKLAVQRNEIAHGQVMPFSATVNGKETASGHFLLSSFHGDIAQDRNIKYAYTVDKIRAFTAEVRTRRSILIDIHFAIHPSVHNSNKGMSAEQQDAVRFASRMAKNEMSRHNFVKWVTMTGFSSMDPSDRS